MKSLFLNLLVLVLIAASVFAGALVGYSSGSYWLAALVAVVTWTFIAAMWTKGLNG